MDTRYPSLIGSYRHTFTSGAVTTIAAGTATAGHILALRSGTAGKAALVKSIEVEFLLTTAFGAAQRVGFDAFIARGYTVAHTGATALTITGGGANAGSAAPFITGRVASTAALTAGTHTLDANPIAKGHLWASAIGALLGPRFYDFASSKQGGLLLQENEGLVVRNLVLMGATGVGEWTFTVEWDELAA
jgi:hypothetical protein